MINYILKVMKDRIKKYKVEYIQGIFICIILEIFIRYSAFNYDKKNEKNYSNFRRGLFKLINGCSLKTKNPFFQKISNLVKGEKYVIQNSIEENKVFRNECVVTTWNFFHFLSHFFLTFFYPFFYPEIFAISFLYEIYEYFSFKCHDLSDVMYNVIGIFGGYPLRKMYDKYNKK